MNPYAKYASSVEPDPYFTARTTADDHREVHADGDVRGEPARHDGPGDRVLPRSSIIPLSAAHRGVTGPSEAALQFPSIASGMRGIHKSLLVPYSSLKTTASSSLQVPLHTQFVPPRGGGMLGAHRPLQSIVEPFHTRDGRGSGSMEVPASTKGNVLESAMDVPMSPSSQQQGSPTSSTMSGSPTITSSTENTIRLAATTGLGVPQHNGQAHVPSSPHPATGTTTPPRTALQPSSPPRAPVKRQTPSMSIRSISATQSHSSAAAMPHQETSQCPQPQPQRKLTLAALPTDDDHMYDSRDGTDDYTPLMDDGGDYDACITVRDPTRTIGSERMFLHLKFHAITGKTPSAYTLTLTSACRKTITLVEDGSREKQDHTRRQPQVSWTSRQRSAT